LIRIFGSVARHEDSPDSDIDLIVRFDQGASLLDQSLLTIAVQELLGVDVAVVSEAGLTQRHAQILREAVAL
jgi:uncharacterized protein